MWHPLLKLICLAMLVSHQAQANSLQLDIEQSSIDATCNVEFVKGEPVLDSLTLPCEAVSTLETHYDHCLHLKGALYCDAPTGTCEHRTCGKGNSLCKPRMGSRERHIPTFGKECLAYAYSMLDR